MCWITRIDRMPMTTEEDIPVYKVMWSTEEKNKFYSYYNEMEYEVGKTYSIEEIKPENVDFIVFGFSMRVNEGFHSYDKDKVEIYDRIGFWDIRSRVFYDHSVDIILTPSLDCKYKDVVSVRCIIPKGSTYYENEYGEIVSNKIIITDEIIEEYDSKHRVRLTVETK